MRADVCGCFSFGGTSLTSLNPKYVYRQSIGALYTLVHCLVSVVA